LHNAFDIVSRRAKIVGHDNVIALINVYIFDVSRGSRRSDAGARGDPQCV
jgi:hypothetical protein